MNVSHAILDDIKHFQQAEPEHLFWLHKLATWNLHLATKILQLDAKRRPNDFF